MNKNKSIVASAVRYIILFICFLCMYFFIIPQSDVFLFARSTDGTLASIFEHSLYYGNGRLLGNLIAVFFSNHFEFSGILMAVSMSIIVYAVNKLLFNNNPHSLFLVAILVTAPSVGILKECHYLFASFVNYMLSLIPILLVMLVMKSCDEPKNISVVKRILCCVFIMFSGAASCLFSENTTIVSVVLSICIIISKIIAKRKITLCNVSYFISTIVGSVIMFMIPKVTETSWKMEHYRSISTTIPEIIDSALGSFIKFSQIFTGFTSTVIALSIALFIFAFKNGGKLKKIQLFVFCLYPTYCVISEAISLTSLYIPWVNLSQAAITALFILAAAITLFEIKDTKLRWNALLISAILSSSVAPMMLVNQYGHRTYVITFFISLFLSVYLLKKSLCPQITDSFKGIITPKQISTILCCTFLALTVFLTSQTIYNFNFYVERTTYIAQEIKSDSKEPIKVPILPNNSTSIEDEYTNIIADITAVGTIDYDITYFTDCENAEQYKAILSDTLPSGIVKAFQKIRFKNPLIINELIKE